jgi:phosphoribosylformylglycinamidine (FGAM) synthase-like amidotransferase family enzyme
MSFLAGYPCWRLQRLPDVCRAAHIIPGAEARLRFTTNRSERFEARLSVEVLIAQPVFVGTAGSLLIAVAHGEGYANFARRGDVQSERRSGARKRTKTPTTFFVGMATG